VGYKKWSVEEDKFLQELMQDTVQLGKCKEIYRLFNEKYPGRSEQSVMKRIYPKKVVNNHDHFLSQERKERILELRDQGLSTVTVAKALGIAYSTVTHYQRLGYIPEEIKETETLDTRYVQVTVWSSEEGIKHVVDDLTRYNIAFEVKHKGKKVALFRRMECRNGLLKGGTNAITQS